MMASRGMGAISPSKMPKGKKMIMPPSKGMPENGKPNTAKKLPKRRK